jgi:predicted ATPase/Tfp pilus assembly protein PilF
MPHDTSAPQGFRVLVIVSRPLDLQDLPNIADQWSLLGGLRRVKAPAFLKILRPPTVEGLRTEILSGYDIVHFDGHGSFGVRCPNCGSLNSPGQKKCGRCDCLLDGEKAKGYFAFEREDGKLDSLAAEDLAEIVMSAPEHPTKLVFLSACESAKGGETGLQSVLLTMGVPAVLGMNESVPVKATMALVAPFYAGLGAGMTIAMALETALPALKRLENGSKLQKIPVLEGPGKDVKILPSRAAGKASFEAEPLFGVPEYEFVGDYIRGDPPGGRKAILSQAMDALMGGEKLVVLTGQGGIGKTVLAAEAARRLSWHYPGGVFWRSAADLERLGLNELLDAFAEVLGWEFRTLPLDAKRDRALNYLRNYDTASLLIVDNAENIDDANLWRFLESIPEPSSALVTTRESLPRGGKEIRVVDMEVEEASRLFIIEARRRSPKWGDSLTQDEMNSLKEISNIMHGHPLAIKLTAALVASRSLASIRDELRRNPPQEVLDRFDVSYADLTESQRELLGCLAVFSSSVTEDTIKSVCVDQDPENPSNWETDLGELVRKSFLDRVEVEVQDEAGKDITLYRYRMHPLMHQYADAKAERDRLIKLRERAANYFLGYAQNFRENFDMLEREKENILSGMNWAVSRQDLAIDEEKRNFSHTILQFMSSLDGFLDMRGYWNEYGISLNQAVKSANALNGGREKAVWVHNLGILAQKMGNYPEARKLYQQSLKIDQELGDKSGVSKSLHELGRLAQATGEYDEARKLYQQSLKIKQELGDKRGVSSSLHQLGTLAQDTGEYDEARKLYQQSLKIKQELGDKNGFAFSLAQLALLEEEQGNIEEAVKLTEQAKVIFEEIGSPHHAEKANNQRKKLEEKLSSN